MIKGIILDLDGVVVNTEPLWAKALIKTFSEIGIKLTLQDCQKTRGLFYKKVVEIWLNKNNPQNKTIDEVNQSLLQNIIALVKENDVLAPGFIDFIERTKKLSLTLGIATSSPAALLQVIFEKYNIQKFFHSFTTGDEIQHFKPHPEIYITQSKKMNLHPSEVIAIEDSIPGMVSAYAAGCKVIAVPPPEDRTRREYSLAHFIAYSFDDIHLDVLKILSENNI